MFRDVLKNQPTGCRLGGGGIAALASSATENGIAALASSATENGVAALASFATKVDRAAEVGDRDELPAGEVVAGDGGVGGEQGGDVALEDDMAAGGARLGPDLDHVVGGADHRLVVLDDDDRVAGVGQGTNDTDEPVDVARVQADRGFVEDEERVDQRGTETGGEVDAFDLAAGERARLAVEGEIAEADLLEVAQAGEDGVEGEVLLVDDGVFAALASSATGGGGALAGSATEGGFEQWEEFGDGELVEFGEGAALPLPAEGLGLEAGTVTIRAEVVGAIPREEDAVVHLVAAGLEVFEEPLQAVPRGGPLDAVFAVARFAVDHVGLLFGGEIGEWNLGRELLLFGEREQVAFRFAEDFAFPALDGAVVDAQRLVGDREAVVDVDHAAETAAFRAGAERRVEREHRRRGGTETAAGLGRVETAGIVAHFAECPMGIAALASSATGGGVLAENEDFVAPEMEGGLDGFGETGLGVGGEGDAVLDDVEGGGGVGERAVKFIRALTSVAIFRIAALASSATGRGREQFVDAAESAVARGVGDEDALVGLALQILEDLRPGHVFRPVDAEGDEHGGAGMGGGGLGPDGLRVVVLDAFAGLRIEALGDVAEPDFEVVAELGHGADGRARRLHRIALLDGDRGADVLDRVDLRLGE